MEDSIKRLTDFDDIIDKDLKDFCDNECAEFDKFPELLEEIKNFEVKNACKKTSRLTMQIMSFVYTCMMDFPNSDFSIKTLISARFLEYLHHIMILN